MFHALVKKYVWLFFLQQHQSEKKSRGAQEVHIINELLSLLTSYQWKIINAYMIVLTCKSMFVVYINIVPCHEYEVHAVK